MNPAEYIRWHDRAVSDPSPPPMDLVRGQGVVYGKKCTAPKPLPPESKKERLKRGDKPRKMKRCGAVTRHYSSAQGRYVCGKCGAPWPAFERQVLRGAVQETALRGDGPERKLARIADVGLAIRKFLETTDTWEARLYLEWARGRSIRELASQGPTLWPSEALCFVWNQHRVKAAVNAGGTAWRAMLTRQRLPFEG